MSNWETTIKVSSTYPTYRWKTKAQSAMNKFPKATVNEELVTVIEIQLSLDPKSALFPLNPANSTPVIVIVVC